VILAIPLSCYNRQVDNQRARAQKIRAILIDKYGMPEWREHLPPLDELVSTILSQNTNDTNRDRAFDALNKTFPDWESVRDAETDAVIETIRPAGLANQKGPRIQQVLKQISEECGSLSLDFLKQWPAEEAKKWLLRFKGVGPKTAAIVLLFSLGKPAFPVDTHVQRVSGRLGLRPAGMSAEKTHDHLANILPPESYYDMHLNLIRLGREICHARNPECEACPLKNQCPYYAEQEGSV
jgi:endonuclease-3